MAVCWRISLPANLNPHLAKALLIGILVVPGEWSMPDGLVVICILFSMGLLVSKFSSQSMGFDRWPIDWLLNLDTRERMVIYIRFKISSAWAGRGNEHPIFMKFSFPRLIVVRRFTSSHEVDGVRKEKERLTAINLNPPAGNPSMVESWNAVVRGLTVGSIPSSDQRFYYQQTLISY